MSLQIPHSTIQNIHTRPESQPCIDDWKFGTRIIQKKCFVSGVLWTMLKFSWSVNYVDNRFEIVSNLVRYSAFVKLCFSLQVRGPAASHTISHRPGLWVTDSDRVYFCHARTVPAHIDGDPKPPLPATAPSGPPPRRLSQAPSFFFRPAQWTRMEPDMYRWLGQELSKNCDTEIMLWPWRREYATD